MKKIELEIVALSHSITQTHSYAVVLGEVNGLRRLPIVIGGFEAQAIAVALEKMQPSRPLTHDLMKNFMTAFNIELHEIIISDLQEGIFYSKLVCSTDNDTIEIDSRTSDALALAVRPRQERSRSAPNLSELRGTSMPFRSATGTSPATC